MSASTPSVAFSLTVPLRALGAQAPRRALLRSLPIVVLLWPLPLLCLGAWRLLGGPASTALQIALAGFPASSRLLLERPASGDWSALAALVVVVVAALALIAAAGLVGGAAAATARTPRDAVRTALRRWPMLASLLFAQALLLAIAAAVVIAAASLAGAVRFQLYAVVLTLGLGLLGIVATRLSLWPAIALSRGLSPLAAMRASWVQARGSVTRLVAAACLVAAVVAIPAFVLRWLITALLSALTNAWIITPSPLAIDLWALIPLPLAVVAGAVLWGHAAVALAAALERWEPGSADEASPSAREASSQAGAGGR